MSTLGSAHLCIVLGRSVRLAWSIGKTGWMNRVLVYAGVAAANVLTAGSRRRTLRAVHLVTKPTLMPLLGWATRPRSGRVRLALATACAGDTAMMLGGNVGLAGAIAGFTATHSSYLSALPRYGRGAGLHVTAVTTAGSLAALGLAGVVLGPRLRTCPNPVVAVPILGYAALVTATGAAAVGTGVARGPSGRPVVAGGVLFVISDVLIAVGRFGPQPVPGRRDPHRVLKPAAMATYCLAQYLLACHLDDADREADAAGGGRLG